jgi:tRNA(fMet)-specific endonuclease VapC
MKILLDTDICIYLIKNKSEGVRKHFTSLHPGDVGISSITVAELCYGVDKSQARVKNAAALEAFLLPLEIVPFDEAAAVKYGGIRAALEKKGTPIGPLDMLIAAQAASLGVALATNNAREFKRVPGLKCVNWA